MPKLTTGVYIHFIRNKLSSLTPASWDLLIQNYVKKKLHTTKESHCEQKSLIHDLVYKKNV